MSNSTFIFLKQVEAASDESEPLKENVSRFTGKIQQIIKEQVSSAFYNPNMIAKDIKTLWNQANEFRFYQRQFLLCVADYIEKSQQMDTGSRQDSNSNTYMKSIL